MKITYFNNLFTNVPHVVDIEEIINRIKREPNEVEANLLHQIRSSNDKETKQKLKKQLSGVCFSGEFTKRLDNQCKKHSGLICVDFDGFETLNDLHEFRQTIDQDPYTFISFVSPSGLGLKCVVKIPAVIENHVKYFNALEKHYDCEYFDTTSKNLSRFCFIAYDPDLYHNEDSELWEEMYEEQSFVEHTKTNENVYALKMDNTSDIIDNLLKWHKKRYPMINGQRNNNAHVLARAFNSFGVNKEEAIAVIVYEYSQNGFERSEIISCVNSAYKNIGEHNTKFFEDSDLKSKVTQYVRMDNKDKAIELLRERNVNEPDEVIKQFEHESNTYQYWELTDRNAIRFLPVMFIRFLQLNGFYKYFPSKSNLEDFIIVKIENNLVTHSSAAMIKQFVLDDLRNRDASEDVIGFFINQTKYFKNDYLSAIEMIDINFLEETKNTSYLYYSDCVVKVTKNAIETIDYIDIDAYVWKQSVLDRDYIPHALDDAFDYNRFVYNISKEGERFDSMKSVIGYLLHGFKRKSYAPAIIFNDEVISDNPEGGTGKGIFCHAISELRRTVKMDGKSWAHDKPFAFQTVNLDTQILVIDDIKKHFNFESLFSIITEGLTIEKKNKDAITLPAENSPKICITTNYAIKGHGNSFERRKFEIEFFKHYDKNFTPEDEFGRLLFDDWTRDDWAKFDAFMIHCLQCYLNTGLVEAGSVNLGIRRLSAASCHEFIEWLGLTADTDDVQKIPENIRVSLDDLMFEFAKEYPDYSERGKYKMSRIQWKRWIELYLNFLGKGDIVRGPKGNYAYIVNENESIDVVDHENDEPLPF